MSTHLRVFPAQDDVHEFEKSDNSELSVHIRLGDLLPLVAMAQKMHFIWLKDFLDDEVCISADLHDVLQAFRGVRPPA
jgi:hypothetical protein